MLEAAYYDGRTARRHSVELALEQGVLRLRGQGVERDEPLSQVRVSERLGRSARLLSFADGAYCEVLDHAGLDALLGAAGHRSGMIERLQLSWPMALLSLLLCIVAAFAGYRWGLPAAARLLSADLPPAVGQQLGESTLQALDRYWLVPSTLDTARQQALRDGYARLQPPPGAAQRVSLPISLVFRSSPKIGPNAFALPDGRVVVLDELVKLAADDEEIDAVLAHEQGHVYYHHGLRLLLQGSAVALAMSAWFGDVSHMLATVPAVLLQTRYSREFEAQADDYAARLLLANRIRPSRLADLLQRLQTQRQEKKAAGDGAPPSFLSSHPATDERMRRLRAADAGLPHSPTGAAAH